MHLTSGYLVSINDMFEIIHAFPRNEHKVVGYINSIAYDGATTVFLVSRHRYVGNDTIQYFRAPMISNNKIDNMFREAIVAKTVVLCIKDMINTSFSRCPTNPVHHLVTSLIKMINDDNADNVVVYSGVRFMMHFKDAVKRAYESNVDDVFTMENAIQLLVAPYCDTGERNLYFVNEVGRKMMGMRWKVVDLDDPAIKQLADTITELGE
jgi:hypothetical protein